LARTKSRFPFMRGSIGGAVRIQRNHRSEPPRWKTTHAIVPSKQIQIKPNKKAWISLHSFGRIRTYQGVTRKKTKKSASTLTRASGCAQKVCS
jgi:hypothetical protein